MKKSLAVLLIFIITALPALAHQPVVVGDSVVDVEDPGTSRAFYDTLKGDPKVYRIYSSEEFDLYVNLLVPKSTNPDGRYSARIYSIRDWKRSEIYFLDGMNAKWKDFYEPFAGDMYVMGPEFKRTVSSGTYEVEVFSKDNQGKYVLAIGEKENFGLKEIGSSLIELPQIKSGFFDANPLSLLLTPMGLFYIAGIVVVAFIIKAVIK